MNPMTNLDEQAIARAVEDAAALANLFLPQFRAYIVLGTVVAKAAPAVYNDVVRLISNPEPTAEDKAALARTLWALAHPEEA